MEEVPQNDRDSNGACIVLETARRAGVEVCFANPGTTEMPFVGALDKVSGVRPVLGLFEGVCTGAADGYGRMAGKPAMTLLHLGPGHANGIANLHNARRARTPILNIVGDHMRGHLKYDAPLTSDIESLARPVSVWYRRVALETDLARDTSEAIGAAMGAQRGVATLVLPVDLQSASVSARAPHPLPHVMTPSFDASRVARVAELLRTRAPIVLLLGDRALSEEGQRAAARIAAGTGAVCLGETFPARTERGGGLPDIDRLPYFPEPALEALAGRRVVLAGARAPITYFGYEGIPAELARPEDIVILAEPGEAADEALSALAACLDAPPVAPGADAARWNVEHGPLNPQAVGRIVSNALPEGAIVSVEGGTCGYPFVTASARAKRHTVLTNTGGAIGQGLPVAIGAAIACPARRVFALQSDGSAQYTIQSLWTMARERLPVIVLIASNRRYGILQTELVRSGLPADAPHASRLTVLDDPPIDWLAIAQGYGVAAERVRTTQALELALDDALADLGGPRLIEMCLP
ncbi:acetolactate synthase large subunit [Trinickia caryophylli]|uniref:Acetolactate synthase-1/2/3 large subunit n=1 Tax=Trinickia caryophylli TaxID=28094 RepID=A0A1X7E8V1_TRICW|nr:acetolactate synthase large subunit [Trinickia caryophylli]PMS13017.1 acetolactate synthase large subunit [Trinickia caryophylli]TRX14778.1 acetolactate synthase large subunit [Trinickia caryophylli]WQE14624.1 acetolactate synthase large subunit [Trinickia caryophylli]SMF29654.1 acetolactate synthase-1/2/3 large subunit [Trinickia caryophylli]GLU31958.1 acetolactate synthase I/II/III large subunit [Trinickia caryophylli]